MATLVLNSTFIGKEKVYPLIRRKAWNNAVVGLGTGKEQANERWKYPTRFWGLRWQLLSAAEQAKMFEVFDACRGTSRFIYFLDAIDYVGVYSHANIQYAIGAVSTTNKTFTFTGLYAVRFRIGWTFKVAGSTGNDEVYTVADVHQTTTTTIVTTVEAIPDDTVDGHILRMYFELSHTYYSGEDYEFEEPKKDIVDGSQVVTVAAGAVTEGVDYTFSDTTGIIIFTDAATPTNGQVVAVDFEFYYRVRFTQDTFEIANIAGGYYDPDDIWLKELKRQYFEAA